MREVNRNVLGYGGRQVERGETRVLSPLERVDASSATLNDTPTISCRIKHRKRPASRAVDPSLDEGPCYDSFASSATSLRISSSLYFPFDTVIMS